MAVLVTGGAGYIGSHMVWALLDAGEDVVVIDRLSTGFRWAVPDAARFYLGDVGDRTLLEKIFLENQIDAVLHFAGSIVVPQSVAAPLDYYENNTAKTALLADAAIKAGVENFVFSSTAAVYGEQPDDAPVRENAPTVPKNPYGQSKLMSELMLRDAARAHKFRYVALRYFNVAGADPRGRTGLSTEGATHLIKIACEAALGRRQSVDVYGTDYPTPDGTGIRDYIHVSDLVEAHLKALSYLRRGGEALVANCGYGRGYSVLQVLQSVKRIEGREFGIQYGPRRPGDPAAVIADSTLARRLLGWSPKHDDLDHIAATALAWERSLSVRQHGDLRAIHRKLAANF
ncbi:UDP-glucose 4-epimerase GalE [Rhizobium sp. SSA_523]|uniref:UDP-glucose 4-epimerase GalE n=1 Tax=Rhizobium sp. SSA_523 TaxID=2952477 RepID=UPI00208FFF6F|nr:UDP-glucose 4-epimerase GalE [Rhizobium sp. SSA_523]MCO5732953.1 UDP-glucose 4-epimerase GalE [Rhizobium sp. SSA_523]WKC23838.1 UDP-glucose 4-epimerase GalE [Rhizobium sp. SSA_523]